jgi:choline dehydrogenase-like flavoprotein
VPPGLPDERGQVDAEHVHPRRLGRGRLELRADARVERIVIEDGEAKGVEYVDGDGTRRRVDAGAVVVAAGTLNTPQLLLRSGLPDSPSSRLVGRNLGFHPVRLVYGLFDEPQDAHMVYPITAHAMAHQHDEDGGFVIEATTIQDPIGFATTLEDENGPLWGARSSRRCAASATGSACSRW